VRHGRPPLPRWASRLQIVLLNVVDQFWWLTAAPTLSRAPIMGSGGRLCGKKSSTSTPATAIPTRARSTNSAEKWQIRASRLFTSLRARVKEEQRWDCGSSSLIWTGGRVQSRTLKPKKKVAAAIRVQSRGAGLRKPRPTQSGLCPACRGPTGRTGKVRQKSLGSSSQRHRANPYKYRRRLLALTELITPKTGVAIDQHGQ
jgi:hypothetical protein